MAIDLHLSTEKGIFIPNHLLNSKLAKPIQANISEFLAVYGIPKLYPGGRHVHG
jgi:hypothetical protein